MQTCKDLMSKWGTAHVSSPLRFDVNGHQGAFLERAAEFAAFERWKKGDFLGIERDFAKRRRQWLSELDLSVAYSGSVGGAGPFSSSHETDDTFADPGESQVAF
jgi:hypothetical protein